MPTFKPWEWNDVYGVEKSEPDTESPLMNLDEKKTMMLALY